MWCVFSRQSHSWFCLHFHTKLHSYPNSTRLVESNWMSVASVPCPLRFFRSLSLSLAGYTGVNILRGHWRGHSSGHVGFIIPIQLVWAECAKNRPYFAISFLGLENCTKSSNIRATLVKAKCFRLPESRYWNKKKCVQFSFGCWRLR